MEWMLVVIFSGVVSNGMLDTFIFTKPTFKTVNECILAANNRNEIPKYIKRLYDEYGEFKEIQKIVCAEKKQIMEIIEKSKGQNI